MELKLYEKCKEQVQVGSYTVAMQTLLEVEKSLASGNVLDELKLAYTRGKLLYKMKQYAEA